MNDVHNVSLNPVKHTARGDMKLTIGQVRNFRRDRSHFGKSSESPNPGKRFSYQPVGGVGFVEGYVIRDGV